MKENIHFYYTNDIHSYFDHWPQIVTFLKEKRERSALHGESSWTVDIGDHMDRVHPISEATMGKANVSLLNEAGYDFVTLGNNEGITLSQEDFYHLYSEANFDVLCANLKYLNSQKPSWLESYKIIESAHGVKIGLFGLTARFNPYYHLLGWDAVEVDVTIKEVLQAFKHQVDIVILLSHLGISEDEMIARNFPDIDLIMGGHTHHLLRTGHQVEHTLLTAAGKHGVFAGEVMLTWDHELKQLSNKEAHAIDITHLTKDKATVKQLDDLEEKADKLLGKAIKVLKEPIIVDWYNDTKIMRDVTEELRRWTEADIAMLNAGLLMNDLDPGVITYKDVHKICPHPINPCVVLLSGEALTEVVRATVTRQFMEIELKGFGFRGKVLGRMVFAGLDVIYSQHGEDQPYVRDILFQQKSLEKSRMYTVATGDLFTFGRILPQVARSEEKRLFLPEFIRDVVAETLKRNSY